jgi:dephospho-CoA kinase
MSFVLGLTGSIGMGKSTTADFFRTEGVPVWDADKAVHALYAQGGTAVEKIGALCLAAIVDGAISRSVLKDWIASDETAIKKIEAVVHPLVAHDRARFRADNADVPLVVLDIPLLFETDGAGNVDAVLVVTADTAEQRRRVLDRPGMTREMFAMILSRQMPDREKQAKADYVIETKTLDQTQKAVQNLIANLLGAEHA